MDINSTETTKEAMPKEEIKEIALELEQVMNKVREVSEKYNLSDEIIAIYLWKGGNIDVNCDGFKGWEITQQSDGELLVKFNFEEKIVKGATEDE